MRQKQSLPTEENRSLLKQKEEGRALPFEKRKANRSLSSEEENRSLPSEEREENRALPSEETKKSRDHQEGN